MMQASSPSSEHSARTVNALITLLSDPDRRIARRIHRQLTDSGPDALPQLRHAREQCRDPLLAERLHAVIDDLTQADIDRQWAALLTPSNRDVDLETGAFLIARTGDPRSDMAPWRQRLRTMAADLARRVHPARGARHNILAINAYLFQTLRFRGNARDYYDPRNSFLHCVLDRRMGIPISLSVVYLLLSQRLNVPVTGVAMPGHFLVGLRKAPLFIDCFHGGTLLTAHECARMLQRSGVAFDPRYLAPCSPDRILARMVRNLIAIAEHRRAPTDRQRWSRLLALFDCRETASRVP